MLSLCTFHKKLLRRQKIENSFWNYLLLGCGYCIFSFEVIQGDLSWMGRKEDMRCVIAVMSLFLIHKFSMNNLQLCKFLKMFNVGSCCRTSNIFVDPIPATLLLPYPVILSPARSLSTALIAVSFDSGLISFTLWCCDDDIVRLIFSTIYQLC